jgi:hypothetical protein
MTAVSLNNYQPSSYSYTESLCHESQPMTISQALSAAPLLSSAVPIPGSRDRTHFCPDGPQAGTHGTISYSLSAMDRGGNPPDRRPDQQDAYESKAVRCLRLWMRGPAQAPWGLKPAPGVARLRLDVVADG